MVRYPDTLVVIPCHNEEKTIYGIISSLVSKYSVLVIDDKSTDNSSKLAIKAGANIISNIKNIGYSNSINLGIKYAINNKYKYVITMDGDGEHSAICADIFRNYLKENCYLAIGIRKQKQRFSEVIMCKYFKIFYGIEDILCGMKGYNLDIFEKYFEYEFEDSIGTGLTYRFLKNNGGHYCQFKIEGAKRLDTPRFGNSISSNFKIIRLFINYLIKDLKAHFAFFRI